MREVQVRDRCVQLTSQSETDGGGEGVGWRRKDMKKVETQPREQAIRETRQRDKGKNIYHLSKLNSSSRKPQQINKY